jgi:hypothetical protein
VARRVLYIEGWAAGHELDSRREIRGQEGFKV